MRVAPLLLTLIGLFGLTMAGCSATPPAPELTAPTTGFDPSTDVDPNEYSIGVADGLDIYV